jgi:hypothetical protein
MDDSNTAILANAAIALIVIGFLLYRQLTPRRVQTDGGGRLMAILGLAGLLQLGQFVQNSGAVGIFGVGMLVVSLALAAVLGTARAYSVRVWQQADGSWWRRGNGLTLVLWVVSIGSHFGVDALAVRLAGPAYDMQGLGNATLLLYLAISLGLQNLLVARRVAVFTRERRTVAR